MLIPFHKIGIPDPNPQTLTPVFKNVNFFFSLDIFAGSTDRISAVLALEKVA
jgi:hypothetical protein